MPPQASPFEARALAAVLASAIGATVTASPSNATEPITGRASVIDGDTIAIQGIRVRFDGIDAPETWQRCKDKAGGDYRCGKAAAEALEAFLAAFRPTGCEATGKDRNGRVVASCYRSDGADVSFWAVRNGHALDWPQYSHGRYAVEQSAALAARVGMWQGPFVEPWEARRQKRRR